MSYERTSSHSHNIHRQHDDWDEVHNQLLAIQKKSLAISNPGDDDEKEADEVARKVTNGESAGIHGTGGTINRKGEGSAETSPEFQAQLQSSKNGGQSLPENLQQEMGSKMGADFSGVKIHTGSEANTMNENVNAKAFVHEQNIYFKNGNYNPDSKDGKELLAHELTHTVQQGSGKIQPKIQRVPNTQVVDGGAMAHADGIYDAAKGVLHTPKNKAGYIETKKTDPQNLYDTFYSIAIRFGIDVKDVMAVNSGVSPKHIKHDMDINIPDIPPKKTTVQTNITNVPIEPQTAADVLTPFGPKSITPQEDLQNIKSGLYNGNPQAQYDAAKRVLTTNFFGPRPKERELLNEIIAKNGNVQVDPLFWAHTYDDFKRYDIKKKILTKGIGEVVADVQKTAWAIVQSDSQIRHTYEFLHRMKRKAKQDERDKELADFFEGGNKKPDLSITNIDPSGETPDDPTDRVHKVIKLNDQNSFTVDVATYLHELNHYIDIWYNSDAYGTFPRSRQEGKKGIKPEKATKTTDLSKTEQQTALAESLNATFDQIILEMQRPARPNDHPRVEGDKRTTKKYLGMSFRESYNIWSADTDPNKETLDKFISDVRNELATAAIGPNLYQPWGAKKDLNNEITETTRIEMGFAFEKMAYGFNSGAKGQWAVDLIQKFEEKYFTYLEDR